MLPPDERGIFGLRSRERSASWLRPSVLWRSRNDFLARISDPTDHTRAHWIEHIGVDPTTDDLAIDLADDPEPSFLVLGDTGEGDASQYAVVPALDARAGGTRFMFILSDVIYPAGEVNDYVSKFHYPYAFYEAPIWAVPGNHDWYDGLNGFMQNFCGAKPLPPEEHARPLLHRLLWRQPSVRDPLAEKIGSALRPRPEQWVLQPAPYFVIETGPLRLVAIDTGIRNRLDAEQGAWLRRVSASSPKPKLLLTGKPLIVDGERRRTPIEGGGEVDEIVRDPAHNYVAAIGGDIHNYQRYPVPLPDGRTLQYVVSGGGGAFMHATHKIGRVEVEGVSEDEFRCYPLRGDSLSFYSHLLRKRWFWRWLPAIPPDEAAEIMARRIGGKDAMPTRAATAGEAGEAVERAPVRLRSRFAAFVVFRAPGPKILQRFFSEIYDWNEPPMFKSFLRLAVNTTGLEIACHAATGCRDDELDPPVEDRVVIPLEGG